MEENKLNIGTLNCNSAKAHMAEIKALISMKRLLERFTGVY